MSVPDAAKNQYKNDVFKSATELRSVKLIMNWLTNCVDVDKTAEAAGIPQTLPAGPDRVTSNARAIIAEAQRRAHMAVQHLEGGAERYTAPHQRGVVLIAAKDMYMHTTGAKEIENTLHAKMDPILLTSSHLLEREFTLSPSQDQDKHAMWLTSKWGPSGEPIVHKWPLAVVGSGPWKTRRDCDWWPVPVARQFCGTSGMGQIHKPRCTRVYK